MKVNMAKSVICDLHQIFKSSVSAVLPENLIRRNVKYNPVNEQLTICGNHYNLNNKNVYVVGTGKAVQSMAVEVENILNSKIKQGIVSIPEGSLKATSNTIAYIEGARNNLPDKNAENTSLKVKELVTGLKKEDLLIVLISGGGSALLSLPKQPVSLEEKTDIIKKLANSGADIKELNIVRKKLSDIKGGKLAVYAHPAEVVSLILSDVVGDPVDLIASGPTVENTDDPFKALKIIEKYNLLHNISDSIKTILKTTEESQTFPTKNVKNHVIGSNKISIAAAVNTAEQLNYIPVPLTNAITGNVQHVAKQYAKITETFCKYLKRNETTDSLKTVLQSLNVLGSNIDIRNAKDLQDKNLCLILGGEITVEVKGSGKGGRNQHLALEFSKCIHEMKVELKDYDVYLLSAGTDGIDGPTDAAGAIGHLDLVTKAKQENLDIDEYLNNNDSYNFYKVFDNRNLHVITGHTGTNVMDIHLILIRCK